MMSRVLTVALLLALASAVSLPWFWWVAGAAAVVVIVPAERKPHGRR